MTFSSPSPPSSSTGSQSPHLMASDLALDPADPLNFLLNPSPMDESGTADFNNQTSSMWPETDFNAQMKPYGSMDFTDLSSLSMDMDYLNAIAVEPSVLQFNNNFNPHYGFDPHTTSYIDEFSPAQFPFTFQVQHDPSSPSDSSSMQSSSSSSGRRLSISSSVSSSCVPLSPAPELLSSPVALQILPNQPPPVEQAPNLTNPPVSDPAALIADRVRQSAGVMLALPMSAQLQPFENQQLENTVPINSNVMSKLPIPRLPRHVSQSIHSNSTTTSAASTPPPTTPSPMPTRVATPSPLSAPQPRPKTSHTTIERRYRTNLNARIQSLRMAVPALRVVDDRDGNKKRAPNKVLVSSDPLRSYTGEDVVDERGFVDGVKVARKCSKANVLGKAVEYIRVLKKREARLKNEQAGLKSLISGLVGGPALLREWEREWKEMFGGEEKDEVEGEVEGEADDDDSDEDGDDDEEGGRKRKRGKTSPSSSASAGTPPVKVEKKEKKVVVGPDGTVPEKRKRGRPRKVVPPPVPPPVVPTEQVQQVQGAQQYLLATFALFSFFNSPLTSFSSPSSPTHVHTGTVLNASSIPLATDTAGGWGLSYFLQIFHLFVSVVVLISCVSNWVGIKIGPVVFGKSRPSSIFTALKDITQKDNENRTPGDWVRLGESYVFSSPNAPSVPLLSRLQAYYHISSWASAGVSDLCTAALALYGSNTPLGSLARAKARSVWNKHSGSTLYERLVLEEMNVDQAAARLVASTTTHTTDHNHNEDDEPRTPMRVLAALLLRERVRGHLGLLFAGDVRAEDDVDIDSEAREKEFVEMRRTIEAAKELGGSVGDLGRRLERLWKVPRGELTLAKLNEDEDEEDGDEVEMLVDAVVLYRRVFGAAGATAGVCEQGDGNNTPASVLMSPPPSPGRKDKDCRDRDMDVGRLRRALGSRLFEESEVLEDARDRVVDMVVELERRNVGLH